MNNLRLESSAESRHIPAMESRHKPATLSAFKNQGIFKYGR